MGVTAHHARAQGFRISFARLDNFLPSQWTQTARRLHSHICSPSQSVTNQNRQGDVYSFLRLLSDPLPAISVSLSLSLNR